jgi:hypothetical protein
MKKEGAPWCEACQSWHPVPRDREHHAALQCFAPYRDPNETAESEATLPPIFETDAAGERVQIGGRPAQRMSEETRKMMLALFGALDLKSSQHVRDGTFHRGTVLGVLDEFREIVQCFDVQFSLLLTPDNTQKERQGG